VLHHDLGVVVDRARIVPIGSDCEHLGGGFVIAAREVDAEARPHWALAVALRAEREQLAESAESIAGTLPPEDRSNQQRRLVVAERERLPGKLADVMRQIQRKEVARPIRGVGIEVEPTVIGFPARPQT
jgi:hypothetical protein